MHRHSEAGYESKLKKEIYIIEQMAPRLYLRIVGSISLDILFRRDQSKSLISTKLTESIDTKKKFRLTTFISAPSYL